MKKLEVIRSLPAHISARRNPFLYLANDHYRLWKRGEVDLRLETSLYRFNTSSGGRVVIFLKTDRDSEAIVGLLPPNMPPNISIIPERLGRD